MSRALLFDPSRMSVALESVGADALLVASPPNVRYLTRYPKGGAALALVRRNAPERPLLLVPAGDIDFLLEDVADGVEARAFGRFHRFRADGVVLAGREALVDAVASDARSDAGAGDLAAEALAEHDPGGVVVTDAPAAAFGPLAGRVRLEPRPELVRGLRMIKTEEEVARLAAAVAITEGAIVRTNQRVAPGVRQSQLVREFAVAVAEASSQVRLASISAGAATALGNVNQPDDVVEPGAVVRYDVGVLHRGYVSDISRCYSVGEPCEKAARYHRALVEGQSVALDALRPGVPARELFTLAVEAVRAAGIPHYDRVNVGHGLGLGGDGYDAPLLAPTDETPIQAGMVLCVETPYYELGFGGLQVEDMVVVTDGGYEPLSRLPRELGRIG